MDPHGILATSAEIAVAIAGFSGIVLAVGPNRLSDLHDGAKFSLSALILVTASTFLFSFVPLLMASAPVPERVLWPAASSLHAFYLIGISLYRLNQTRRIRREDQPTGTFYLLPILAFSALLLQLANAFWIRAPWPYLLCIVMMNVAGLSVFASLLRRWVSED